MISIDRVAALAGVSPSQFRAIADRCNEGRGFSNSVLVSNRGSRRTIVRPGNLLDLAVKNLSRTLPKELSYTPPSHVHGFVKGRSTLTNAQQHLGKPCVLRVDLMEFFPSIRAARVFEALLRHGFEVDAAHLCLRVVTLNGRLPIGLSTSPLLSNLVFEETDTALAEYSMSAGLSFTRYVDDLVFSGIVGDRQLFDVRAVLEANNWIINDDKIAFMRRGKPQYVTGLYVGNADRPRIPRRIKRQMRWICHIIQSVGYGRYLSEFGGTENNMFPDRLLGWARYIASVEPELGLPMIRMLDDAIKEDGVRILESAGELGLASDEH